MPAVFGQAGGSNDSGYVTIKLKDGAVLEGEIVAEDELSLSIYLEFAGGTITQSRRINKAEIAEIARWTPEQKAEWQTKRDYEMLQKHQLNPNDSYQLEYYDHVIDNVFHKFLTDHPDSPYASNATERIVQWIAERSLVAAGNVKFHGRWAPAAEAAPLIERERGQQLLQQARTLIAQGRFESAIQDLQVVVHMKGQPALVTQAKPLLASAYQLAVNLLDQQQQQLEGELAPAQQRVDQARQTANQAEASLAQAMSSGRSLGLARDAQSAPSYQALGGNTQPIVQAQIAANKARSDLNSAQNHLEQVKSQLDAVSQKLAALKSQTPPEYVAAPTSASPATTNQSTLPVLATADLPGPLAEIVAWVKKNWMALAIVGFGLVYVMSRFAKG